MISFQNYVRVALRIWLRCLLVFLASAARAQEEGHERFPLVTDENPIVTNRVTGGFLTIYFDNDLFGGTDENYSNGVRASWISRSRSEAELTGIYRGMDKASTISRIRKGTSWNYNYGVSLTQLMFTPRDIATPAFLPEQRPYAGWLGLGLSLHAMNANELHSLELLGGILGPDSLGETMQDFVHDLREIPKANGWDHQLANEPTFNLHYRRSRRISPAEYADAGFGIDSFYRWGGDVGTLAVNANGGLFVRLGYNLPLDFSDPKLSLTAYTHQMFYENAIKKRVHRGLSLYTTLSTEFKAVAHDVFLDGNVFHDSHSVDKKPIVADFTAAFAVRYRRFQLSYAHTYRTQEFASQEDGHLFGSVTASYEF